MEMFFWKETLITHFRLVSCILMMLLLLLVLLLLKAIFSGGDDTSGTCNLQVFAAEQAVGVHCRTQRQVPPAHCHPQR